MIEQSMFHSELLGRGRGLNGMIEQSMFHSELLGRGRGLNGMIEQSMFHSELLGTLSIYLSFYKFIYLFIQYL